MCQHYVYVLNIKYHSYLWLLCVYYPILCSMYTVYCFDALFDRCLCACSHLVAVNLFLPVLGLSKFAKLARSVTRSRQFSAHLPTLKDPTKQSNLAHVSPDYRISIDCIVLPIFICSDDVAERGYHATVPTGSPQNAATHTPALLCI